MSRIFSHANGETVNDYLLCDYILEMAPFMSEEQLQYWNGRIHKVHALRIHDDLTTSLDEIWYTGDEIEQAKQDAVNWPTIFTFYQVNGEYYKVVRPIAYNIKQAGGEFYG